MPEQNEQPRPQGDPLRQEVVGNPEENRAQRDSDAPPDASVEPRGDAITAARTRMGFQNSTRLMARRGRSCMTTELSSSAELISHGSA